MQLSLHKSLITAKSRFWMQSKITVRRMHDQYPVNTIRRCNVQYIGYLAMQYGVLTSYIFSRSDAAAFVYK